MSDSSTLQGRVSAVHKAHTEVLADGRMYEASVRGSFHNKTKDEWPKVGDYVQFAKTGDTTVVIEEVLPRKNTLTRRVSFADELQVMVANVDWLAIVMGLDNDYNPRRLKRYLALAETSDVSPLIVLTKADAADGVEHKEAEVKKLAPNVAVHVVSNVTKEGVDKLAAYLEPGITMVLLGSSGAGKSSLTNVLLDMEVARVGGVRDRDERGRHTTTRRQLHLLANGAAIIDTPGLRELAMEDEVESAEAAYPEIARLARECRFRDCDHKHSAGCVLTAAVAKGELAAADLEAFLKLKNKEVRHRRTRSVRR